MEEQAGLMPTAGQALRMIGERLLNDPQLFGAIRITKYDEWRTDDGWRAEVQAIDRDALMTFVYERSTIASPWGLIAVKSEQAPRVMRDNNNRAE